MNLSVLHLFARSSVSSLRTHSCFVVPHSLKMPRSSNVHKRFKSSTSKNPSKLFDSLSTEDFDFDEDSPAFKADEDAITNGDPKMLKALKSLQLQVDLLKLQQLEMPSSLSTENWKELLMCSSTNQRRKFLHFLWLKEQQANMKVARKREKQESYKKYKASEKSEEVVTTSSPIEYGLAKVFLFPIFRDHTINQLYNYQLIQAEWFGPHIILDCSYDLFMSPKNLATCSREMTRAWSTNRENLNPFDLFFCNFDPKGRLWPKFMQVFPNLNHPDCPIHYTNEHYLEFFPIEKLVYLTPHCNEMLEEYSSDDVYIIGAYVDAGSCEQLSLAKAKKDGLRKAKLPLDRYLRWKRGSKSLSLHTVLAIMNDLKDGLSWPEALKHVPQRRLVDHEEHYDTPAESEKMNHSTAASIRESYRKNLVYDLLLKRKLKRDLDDS